MKLKTILLFIVLFLFLAGCQTNKLGTDTQSGMSDENKLPTVNSAYPVNSATSNQSASPAAQKDSDSNASSMNSNKTESNDPYPMDNSSFRQDNPYPMNNDNNNAVENTDTGQPSSPSLNSQYVFKTSEPNTATLHGELLIMDPMLAIPDSKDGLFLVPLTGNEGIVTIPPFTVGEVPQADVNEITGEFVFVNI
jgi:hypothetical protein